MAMWNDPNCDTCGGGLRPWLHLAPPNPAVALDEDHPMDVGNRWGILTGAAGAPLRRVQRVFAGLGDDSSDNPPVDTSSTSGSIDSSDNVDSAVNPTISPVTANPGEPITAQSDPNASKSSNGSFSSGGSPGVNVTEPGTDYTPWIIGGALVLGAGVAGAIYLRRHRRLLHHRR